MVITPELDSLGCVWPNLKSPHSGFCAIVSQPPFSCSACATVAKEKLLYFCKNAWYRSSHTTKTMGESAIGSSFRIGFWLYLTCHSWTKISLYNALAGDHTWIR